MINQLCDELDELRKRKIQTMSVDHDSHYWHWRTAECERQLALEAVQDRVIDAAKELAPYIERRPGTFSAIYSASLKLKDAVEDLSDLETVTGPGNSADEPNPLRP